MRFLWIVTVLAAEILFAALPTQDQVCKKCHPAIFKEYYGSAHRKASVYNDEVHRAVWEKHPLREKGKYGCKKCHSPSDTLKMREDGLPVKSAAQVHEPISCVYCHAIKDVEKHAKANTNVIVTSKGERVLLFSADEKRKGQKITFKEERGFLGLTKKVTGSPYHDIDYGNEAYYTGRMCLGCHDHKQNANQFAVCEMGLEQKGNKNSCISCHMPQVAGSATTIKKTGTHAYHGMGSVESLKLLERYITFKIEQTREGFTLLVKNEANHMLLMHPLRMAKITVELQREGKKEILKSTIFHRVIGKEGKPSMPWLANEVVADTMLKAGETRKIPYGKKLQKGDRLTVILEYYRVSPKAAEKLGLQHSKAAESMILKKELFSF
ncbi:MAG: hypothetical protein B6D59_08050 [Campylobacteraceae bacterium 4484_4]|nr:MAG: hypothetical protein B6D59_08050 [Campylobacteraceae bacterium 4484_4]